MHKSDFNYHLPGALIAQAPLASRSASRLLCLDGATGSLSDRQFLEFPDQLRAGDLLVFNDTRVIPARMYGQKQSGGNIEVVIERILPQQRALALVRASKSPKPGQQLMLEGNVPAEVVARHDDLFELQFHVDSIMESLEQYGHVPLPPYIERPDDSADQERYQTVYANRPGAVAAPTAGLHFDEATLKALEAKGINSAYLTLHVGAGTFQPLRADDLKEHRMHSEVIHVSDTVCQQISETRASGGRIIAVGTTVVRSLETAAKDDGVVEPYEGETDIFIYPGYSFKVVDAMLTNFHLPESTLLMLVCAFAGTKNVLHAYNHAIANKYRFYSYGDAMFLKGVGDKQRIV